MPRHYGSDWSFASITAFFQRIGKPAGDMDVLIAATAMVHGHTLEFWGQSLISD